jgi:long-chain acyl-CoA synthetase
MTVLLHDAFEAAALRRAAHTALVADGERISYADLHARVLGLAEHLVDAGVQPGDRVLILLDNGIEFAVAVHAVLRAGAVFVPVSPATKSAKLAYLMADTEAVALFTQANLRGEWLPALSASPAVRWCCVAGESGELPADARVARWPSAVARGDVPAVRVAPDDLAALIYTSGTTGVPKGVMLSHRNMCSAWRSVQAYLQLREDDVIGLALPPAFSYGLYFLLMGLGLGATVVLERSVAFPVKLLQCLARERVTVFPGVPTLFSALLAQRELAGHDLSALRLITSAAAALPEAHVARLRGAFAQARLFSMYGMTECKRVSFMPPEELEHRPGSVGRGMPYQTLWLADANGRRLPPGGQGELVVQGEHVMRGYWRKPAETAERLRTDPASGRTALYTGDIFRSDGDGYLYFVARADDIIKSRGEKVSPREVEEVLYRMPGVKDAAVVGVPDEALGQAVKAYVTLQAGAVLSVRDVVRHCLAALESHMAPKYVEFVDELPRTDSGKVRRASLR